MDAWNWVRARQGLIAAGLATALLAAGPVRAQQLCDDVALPNKLFGAGGSGLTATLKRLSLAVEKGSNKTDARSTLFYLDDLGACPSYEAFLNGKVPGKFRYWIAGAANDADQRCDARGGGQPLDFAYLPSAAAWCDAP